MHAYPKYMILPVLFICSLLICVNCKNKLSPQNPIPEGLQITAPSSSIYSGGTLQLSAVVNYKGGSTEDVSSDVIWTVSPGEAAYMSDAGLFTAILGKAGIETIRADYQGQTASLDIEVVVAAKSLSVWPVRTSIASGKTLQLTAVAEFDDASLDFVHDRIQWSIEPGIAASIDDNGLLHAISGAAGQETVTGSLHSLSVQSSLTIETTVQAPYDMVTIPAGSYTMGDDQGWRNEKPAHEVYLHPFEISRYEITNSEYVDYLNEALDAGEIIVSVSQVLGKKGPFTGLTYFMFLGSQEFPERFIAYSTDDTGVPEFEVRSGYENHPVVRISWYGAAAFCGFYGLRLPTEAEWEKACRGGQQLQYGTQDGTISHNMVNYLGTEDRDSYGVPAPVGMFPPNPFGLYDMSGNAAEWVFDAYSSAYYYISPTHNPTGPGPLLFIGRLPNEIALFRGGSWASYPFYCRSACRSIVDDDADMNYLLNAIVGFRVARSVD